VRGRPKNLVQLLGRAMNPAFRADQTKKRLLSKAAKQKRNAKPQTKPPTNEERHQ
jgi:hypothetical protein